MPRQIPHVPPAETNILDVAIPTPQPADVAPSLNQVNAITGPIIAGLVNDLTLSRAYVDALLASHAAKDRQIAALKDRLTPSENGTGG